MFPIRKEVPLQVDSLSWYAYSSVLEKLYTVTSKYGDIVRGFKISGLNGQFIGLPRGVCPKGHDATAVGSPIAITCKFPPRDDEQKRVIGEAKTLLKLGESFIFQATTGFGKTFVAANLIASVGRTTLVIVTKEDLMHQWRAELKKFLGLEDWEIGIAQQDKCDFQGKKIVLGMVHSLSKGKYGQAFESYFGLIVYDEVHRMGAETFSETAGMFPARLRLGLSATPIRSDGKEFLFKAHIGEVRVVTDLLAMPPKILFQRTLWVPPDWMRETLYDSKTGESYRRYQPNPGKMMPVYKALAKSKKRNDLIVDFTYSAFVKDRNIILFSDLREDHLVPLMAMCKRRGIPEDLMAFYVGGLSKSAREHAKAHANVLFATYQMAAEATDIPRLDTAVFCTPRANVKQPVGRILRPHFGKKEPVVYDLVDSYPLLLNFMSARRRVYHGLGSTKMIIL